MTTTVVCTYGVDISVVSLGDLKTPAIKHRLYRKACWTRCENSQFVELSLCFGTCKLVCLSVCLSVRMAYIFE